MKLTIRTIVKALTLIILVVFLGPSLISFFERPSGEESYKAHRRQVKHDDDNGFVAGKSLNNGGGAKSNHVKVVNSLKLSLITF